MHGPGVTKVTLGSSKSELNHGRVVLNHTLGEQKEILEKSSFRPPREMLFEAFWRPSGGQSTAKGDFRKPFLGGHFSVSKRGWGSRAKDAGKEPVVP